MNNHEVKLYRHLFFLVAFFEPFWGIYLKYFSHEGLKVEESLAPRLIFSTICIGLGLLTYKKEVFKKYSNYLILSICGLGLIQQTYLLLDNQYHSDIYFLGTFGSFLFVNLIVPNYGWSVFIGLITLGLSALFPKYNYFLMANVATFLPLLLLIKISFFNAMKKLKEAKDDAVEKTKLDTVGDISTSISHELNNNLSKISLAAEFLLVQIPEEQMTEETNTYLNNILTHVQDSGKLIKSLGFLSQDKNLVNIGEESLDDELNFLKSFIRTELRKVDTEIRFNFKNSIKEKQLVNLDTASIKEVFHGLVKNAIYELSTKEGKDKFLKINCYDSSEEFFIEIINSGEKIPEKVKEKMFGGFYTTKPVGDGVGLGLSVAKKIMTQHNGKLYLRSYEETEHTTFVIVLPKINKDIIEGN